MDSRVYDYLDYVLFLKDELQKMREAGTSLRTFARKAGIASHTHLSQVISGKKKATLETISRFANGFGMTDAARDFLELLFKFKHADTIQEKNSIYKKIIRRRPKSAPYKLEEALYYLYENWYILAIRELIGHPDFRNDPKWISRQLEPNITAKQVTEAIQILLEAGFVKKTEGNGLELTKPDSTTGKEVKSLAILNYHMRLLTLAAEAMHRTPAKFRDISSVSTLLDHEEFLYVKERIQEFRTELYQYITDRRKGQFPATLIGDQPVLYFLNIQLYNGSKIPWR